MRILSKERAKLDQFLPGLDQKLQTVSLNTLESPENEAIEWYREAGGPGLLIPREQGGSGASALCAVQLTRALASRAPSLALATTMHQFSVASLLKIAQSSEGPEWMLLDAVARDRRLMASAFAEGKTGQSILEPTMKAVWDGEQWRISGRKQPCSLSRSMDLLTASVLLEHPDKPSQTGVALIPAQTPGIRIEPFWSSMVLAGAESDAVILEDVKVHPELLFALETPVDALDDLQTIGFIWFELLLSACYLGACSALVEKLLINKRGPTATCVELCTQLECANIALDGMASHFESSTHINDTLAQTLIVRYSLTNTIQSITAKTVELLGGMAFIGSSDIAYLAAVTHAIGFHPPSRHSQDRALMNWFSGKTLVIE